MNIITTLKSHPLWSVVPAYEFLVNISNSDISGAININGQDVGTFKFYNFTDYLGRPRSILKVIVGDSRQATPDAHFFLCINDTNDNILSYVYLGFSAYLTNQDIIITPALIALVKFVDNPLLLNDTEWQLVSDAVFGGVAPGIFKNIGFKTSFTYLYFSRILDTLSTTYPADIETKIKSFGSYYFFDTFANGLDSYYTKILLGRLLGIWDKLSLDMKFTFLSKWTVSNSIGMDYLCQCCLKFIDNVNAIYPNTLGGYAGLRRSKLISVFPTFKSVLTHLGVDSAERRHLLNVLLDNIVNGDYYTNALPVVLDFLNEVLIQNDKILYNKNDYDAQIKIILDKALNSKSNTTSFTKIFNNFTYDLNQQIILENYIDSLLSTYSGALDSTGIFLFSALNWKHNKKQQILDKISPYFNSWFTYPIASLNSFLNSYGNRALPDSIDKAKFYQGLIQALIIHFPERGPQDNWGGTYDTLLENVMNVMDEELEYYDDLLKPLLYKFNPQQINESNFYYQDRLDRLGAILETHLFIYDLKGGLYQIPKLINVIENFAYDNPNWVQILVLSTIEGGESKPGVSQFNWLTVYKTPQLLATSLLHEGTHALDLRNEPENQLLDILAKYWFYEHEMRNILDYPSTYAATNINEYIAEMGRYFMLDGKKWIQEGIDRFLNDHPALLNMMMYFYDFLFESRKLNEDGILVNQNDIDLVGDRKIGYSLVIADKIYNITYKDNLIDKVTLDIAPQPEPDPEPDPDPNPEPQPDPEPNKDYNQGFLDGYSKGFDDCKKLIIDNIFKTS